MDTNLPSDFDIAFNIVVLFIVGIFILIVLFALYLFIVNRKKFIVVKEKYNLMEFFKNSHYNWRMALIHKLIIFIGVMAYFRFFIYSLKSTALSWIGIILILYGCISLFIWKKKFLATDKLMKNTLISGNGNISQENFQEVLKIRNSLLINEKVIFIFLTIILIIYTFWYFKTYFMTCC